MDLGKATETHIRPLLLGFGMASKSEVLRPRPISTTSPTITGPAMLITTCFGPGLSSLCQRAGVSRSICVGELWSTRRMPHILSLKVRIKQASHFVAGPQSVLNPGPSNQHESRR